MLRPKRPDHRKALAAKVSPVSRLNVTAERLLATIARSGTLPTQADIKAIDDVLSRIDVGALRTEGGDELTRLCGALVTWLSAIVRWPSPSSTTESAAHTGAWRLIEQLRIRFKLFTWSATEQLLPPQLRSTDWVGALLDSDALQAISRAISKEAQAVIGGLESSAAACGQQGARAGGSSASTAYAQSNPQQLSVPIISSVRLLSSISAAAYAQSCGRPVASGPQPLRVQLVEIVRRSHVLDHLARGMAVLAMRRGAEVAAREQGGGGAGGSAVQTCSALSRDFYNHRFLDVTGISPWEADSPRQRQWQWPPPAAHVDLTVCGPWSQHLLLAWGLHHLHALDGGGHCGLHPDMVRGLPPAWEPPAQGAAGGPQAAASTSRAGAGADARSSGSSSSELRVLPSRALWRLIALLQQYATRSDAVAKVHLLSLPKAAEARRGAASVVARLQQMRGHWAERVAAEVEVAARMHAATGGSSGDSGGRDGGGGSALGDGGKRPEAPWPAHSPWPVRDPVVRLLAARVVRAAVASAQAWQREKERGKGGGGAGAEFQAAGDGSGGQRAGCATAEAVEAAPSLALSETDIVPLALRALSVYGISVRAWEERRDAAGAGAGEAGAGPREGRRRGTGVRLRTEMYRLGLQVLQHVEPRMAEEEFNGLTQELRLGLPPLPNDGSLPPDPPPRLAAALAAGYLPALEHYIRRWGRGAVYCDMRLLDLLLGGPGGGPGGEGSVGDGQGHGQRQGQGQGHEGCHDLLWLLAYGDRDQAGALVSSLAKALDALCHMPFMCYGAVLTHGSSEASQAQSISQVLASAAVLLGRGVEVCEQMAAAGAGGGPEGRQEQPQQLREVVSLAVHALRHVLYPWAYKESIGLYDGPTFGSRGEQLARAVPALLCVLGCVARTKLHRHRHRHEAAGGQAAGAGSTRGGDVGGDGGPVQPGAYSSYVDLDLSGDLYTYFTTITAWQQSLLFQPLPSRAPCARAVVDLAWCVLALVQEGAETEGHAGQAPLVLLKGVTVAQQAARAAGDVPTVQLAEAYTECVKGLLHVADGVMQLTTSGTPSEVPPECVSVEGEPWLLDREEARRRLPRACWNRGCRRLEGDSEAGAGLAVCGRCRGAWYCCRECQQEHWSKGGHKEECRKAAAGVAEKGG